jgi:hypothetical protein
MSEEGQTQKSDLEAFKGLVDYVNESFARAYDIVEIVPANFVYEIANSPEVNDRDKAGIIRSLSEIGTLMDLLKTGYDNTLSIKFLDDPDNVKKFTAIMSRLIALYRGFRNGELVKATELSLAIDDVAYDLRVFFIRYMKSINMPE